MSPTYKLLLLCFLVFVENRFITVDAFSYYFPAKFDVYENRRSRASKKTDCLRTLDYNSFNTLPKSHETIIIKNQIIQSKSVWNNDRRRIKLYSSFSEFDWNTIPYTNFFAFSLFPYLSFLYKMWKDESSEFPVVSKLGFTYLLFFVFGTIIGGISSKVIYDELLANVDWIHGTAEALLGLTNVMVAVGFKRALDASQS